jgi:hypothetical protein
LERFSEQQLGLLMNYRELFTEDQWDLIYNFIGNALDDDDFNADDVYAIRTKIHQLFED